MFFRGGKYSKNITKVFLIIILTIWILAKYNIIYSNLWTFTTRQKGKVQESYNCMSLKDICNLPVVL